MKNTPVLPKVREEEINKLEGVVKEAANIYNKRHNNDEADRQIMESQLSPLRDAVNKIIDELLIYHQEILDPEEDSIHNTVYNQYVFVVINRLLANKYKLPAMMCVLKDIRDPEVKKMVIDMEYAVGNGPKDKMSYN